MALLTYWSGQSDLPIDGPEIATALHGFQHRLAHLAAFGLLGLLARWAFGGASRAALWALLLTAAFGATDEWHQSFTAGRRAALDDWATDIAFAAVAIVVWARLRVIMLISAPMRAVAPVAVAAIFALGIGTAIYPSLPRVRDPDRPSLRSVPGQVVLTARDVARSTRNLARQFRDGVAG
jgi:VanZ family protein